MNHDIEKALQTHRARRGQPDSPPGRPVSAVRAEAPLCEGDLTAALMRKNPPAGFTDRVMARLPEAVNAGTKEPEPSAGGKVRTMPLRRSPWLALGLAASLAVGSFAGLRYQQYRQGREASRQLLLALQITGEKLTLAQHKVVGISERRIDQ